MLFLISDQNLHYGGTKSSRHGCISDASMRRLKQRIRDISKRTDLQISETSPGRLIKDISLETSLRSLRHSQRRFWVASEAVILCPQTKSFFGNLFIYLRVFTSQNNVKLLRAWFKLEIYLGYLYKRKAFFDQMGYLRFP